MTTVIRPDDPRMSVADVAALLGGQGVSEPVDHGSACCRTARRWLGSIHAAGAPSAPLSGLAWISEMYPWGPSGWPISWCELVEQEKLDCGAQAALAREALRDSGSVVLGVQLLIRASSADIAHWRRAWADGGIAPGWLFERLYYHEAVGVSDDHLVVFDPTRNWKIPPDATTSDGTVAAIRVSGGHTNTVQWGQHELTVGDWTVLSADIVRRGTASG